MRNTLSTPFFHLLHTFLSSVNFTFRSLLKTFRLFSLVVSSFRYFLASQVWFFLGSQRSGTRTSPDKLLLVLSQCSSSWAHEFHGSHSHITNFTAEKIDIPPKVLFNLGRRGKGLLGRLDGQQVVVMRRAVLSAAASCGRRGTAACGGPAGVHLSTLPNDTLTAAVGALRAIRRLVHRVKAARPTALSRHVRRQ